MQLENDQTASKLYKLVKIILSSFVKDATNIQILNLSIQEQRAFIEDLLRNNSSLKKPSRSDNIYKIHKKFGFLRKYSQLPCTLISRQKRASFLEQNGFKNKRVLLLGDDDFVSVELAKNGFSDVTVADKDTRLLETIKKDTSNMPNQPKIIESDFYNGFVSPGLADVVCLDPAYNLWSTKKFLSCAIACLAPEENARIILMLNPWCFGKTNLEALDQFIQDSGLQLESHHKWFNQYPITRLQAIVFRLIQRVFFRQTLSIYQGFISHTYSDCFVLRIASAASVSVGSFAEALRSMPQ